MGITKQNNNKRNRFFILNMFISYRGFSIKSHR